jgi:hypothetical protein
MTAAGWELVAIGLGCSVGVGLVALTAAASFGALSVEQRRLALVAAVIVGTNCLQSIFFETGDGRHRVPTDPVLLVLGALGLVSFVGLRRRLRPSTATLPSEPAGGPSDPASNGSLRRRSRRARGASADQMPAPPSSK